MRIEHEQKRATAIAIYFGNLGSLWILHHVPQVAALFGQEATEVLRREHDDLVACATDAHRAHAVAHLVGLAHLFERRLLALLVLEVAARLERVLVDAPVEQVVVERECAHVVDQVQLARAIQVEHGVEGGRVAIEEELVVVRVYVVAQFGHLVRVRSEANSPEATLRQRLQCLPAHLVPLTANV